jgi:hypothetical protein
MTLGRLGLVVVIASAALMTTAAAAVPPAMQAGAWSRSTTFELTGALKMLAVPMKSTVCIHPDIAKRGPLALVLAGDEPDCRLVSSTIRSGDFTARRACSMDKGGEGVFDMSARYTSGSIDMTSMIRSAHGGQVRAHSEFHYLGPCRVDTPLPGA